MKVMKKAFALFIIITMLLSAIPAANAAEQADSGIRINPVSGIGEDFIMGADVSMLNDIVKYGGKFYDVGSTTDEDCLVILKAHGINWIRLRLWNDPVTDENGKVGNDTVMIDGKAAPACTSAGAGTCDEATTIATAQKAKALGMKFLLDFHYSDFWADPGKQTKPKAWKDLTGSDLQDAVYNYTKQVLQHMKDSGVMPDMVQIGNETNNGMLYPDGNTSKGFAGWIGLLNAASSAVREIGGSGTKIMIHLANGGDNSLYRRVFDKLTNFADVTDYVAANDKYNGGRSGVDFDVIGFSYYPFWHGTLDKFRQNMDDVAKRYGKQVAVAEIGYGYTFDNGDDTGNAFGKGSDELSGYQATVQGQAQIIRDVIEVVSQAKDSSGNPAGIGIFYWAPEWIPVLDSNGKNQVGWITGGGNDSENRALFDFTGHALPSLDVFKLVRKNISELPGGKPYAYEITSLRSSSITASVGAVPELPETVLADYSDGTIRSVPVVWDKIEPALINRLQDFTLNGSVQGTSLKAVLNVKMIGKKNYVADPGFESGDLDAWTVTKDSAADVEIKNESSPGNNAYTGNNCFSYYISPKASGFTLQQTVTGLPDGSYTLRVVSHGGDTAPDSGTLTRYLFAKDYGGDEIRTEFTNNGWRNWITPEIKNLKVTGGKCTIGVRVDNAGSGTWGKLDDFELYPDLSAANLTLPYSIPSGTTFEANLSYGKLIYNIYGQDITISYNAGKLEYISAKGTTDDILVTSVDSRTPGKVRILAACTGAGGISWNADSLKLTFRSKANAEISSQDLVITKALLGTGEGNVVEPAGLATLRMDKPSGSDGGTGDSGYSGYTSSTDSQDISQPKNGIITVNRPSVIGGKAIVNISKSTIDSAFETALADRNGIRTVHIQIPGMAVQSSYETVLPAANLASGSMSQKIAISTSVGSITVPANMLTAAETTGAGNVGIQISQTDTSAFGSELRKLIGDRPVIEVALKIDGRTVSWNNPNAPVTVSVPYKPGAEELKDPEHIVIWYIDGGGNAVSVPNGRYDPASGQAIFTTTHFSKYAVAYSVKTFNDLEGYGWAKDAIEVLASKGAAKGNGNGGFTPGAYITRADFTLMLVDALGLSAKISASFSDVKEGEYYYEAAGIAKKLGISAGTGNNRFSPKDCISRQDMLVMIQKALVVSGRIPAKGTAASLENFSDSSGISKYAYDSISRLAGEGLVKGSGNAIRPRDRASRAEAAVMVYRASKM